MKNERIYIRTTEKTKLKLLKKSQEYDMSLSDFILNVAENACELDVVQVWINAYINWVSKQDYHTGIITHYKTVDGEDAWSVSAFEDTYFSRVELLEACKYNIDMGLPKMLDVLDQWDEFVSRLKVLGMWEELDVTR